MTSRKLRAAASALALIAFGAVWSSTAQAQWTIALGTLGASESESVLLSAKETFTVTTKVLGTPVKITASGVSCSPGCFIEGQNAGTNHGSGGLNFSGATVDEPFPGCGVTTFKSKPLKFEAIMDPKLGSGPVFVKFSPQSGETFMEFEFWGVSCPLSELTMVLKGTLTAQFKSPTGTSVSTQTLTFGNAAQETGGGSIKAGKEAVTFSGVANMELFGSHAFQVFGVDE
jgi:hypothetical protein